MTREEIDQMTAGREMDVAVAQHFLGWQVCRAPGVGYACLKDPITSRGYPPPQVKSTEFVPVPAFSSDIASAWDLVEHAVRRRLHPHIERVNDTWEVNFFGDDPMDFLGDAESSDVCEAICRAALDSVRYLEARHAR